MILFLQNFRSNLKSNIKITRFLFLILFISLYVDHSLAQEYELVWSDEFDGTALDGTKWSYQHGNGQEVGLSGWGNNELEYYLEENAVVDSGYLTIIAKKENYQSYQYTSARIRTINKGDWKYGKIEMRAKMPYGKGIWPAFWMMPTDNVYGGWASSGEIDIMEYLGHQTNIVHGTIHYGGSWPNNTSSGGSYTLPSGGFNDDFHVFTLEWEEGKIQWLVDGEVYSTKTSWYSSAHAFPAPFDQRFHIILNLAVGGNWPGNPDATTQFPQEYVLDYIRVYQKPTTGVDDKKVQAPVSFLLDQNYPNPFNSQTIIKYEISKQSYVKLFVTDVLGRQMKVLIDETQEAGVHSFSFDAADLSSGSYIYTLSVDNKITSRKLILMK